MGLFSGGQKRKDIQAKVQSYSPFASVSSFLEQEGLPIEAMGLFAIAATNEKIVIMDIKREFLIDRAQIKSVTVKFERKEKTELQTSTVKGIAGGVMFGTAGAIVGSQPKQKIVSVSLISNLIIEYVSTTKDTKQIILTCREIPGVHSTLEKFQVFETAVQKRYFSENIVDSGTYQL